METELKRGSAGNTSLHRTCVNGERVDELVQKINLDVKNYNGETPLHLCIHGCPLFREKTEASGQGSENT
jgi:ankyrin repeat protein